MCPPANSPTGSTAFPNPSPKASRCALVLHTNNGVSMEYSFCTFPSFYRCITIDRQWSSASGITLVCHILQVSKALLGAVFNVQSLQQCAVVRHQNRLLCKISEALFGRVGWVLPTTFSCIPFLTVDDLS